MNGLSDFLTSLTDNFLGVTDAVKGYEEREGSGWTFKNVDFIELIVAKSPLFVLNDFTPYPTSAPGKNCILNINSSVNCLLTCLTLAIGHHRGLVNIVENTHRNKHRTLKRFIAKHPKLVQFPPDHTFSLDTLHNLEKDNNLRIQIYELTEHHQAEPKKKTQKTKGVQYLFG